MKYKKYAYADTHTSKHICIYVCTYITLVGVVHHKNEAARVPASRSCGELCVAVAFAEFGAPTHKLGAMAMNRLSQRLSLSLSPTQT